MPPTRFPNGISTPLVTGGALDGLGGSVTDEATTGVVFFVNDGAGALAQGAIGGSNDNSGLTPIEPFATIDYAIGRCTANRGDKIIVMSGHTDPGTAVITMDVAGVTLEGEGLGQNRGSITAASASIDVITVTAANCKIQNLLFNARTDSTTTNAFINVAAADCHIDGNYFDAGQFDFESVTLASGARGLITNNEFHISANGPDAAIEFEGTVDGTQIYGNLFNGGSGTNEWDVATM